MAKMFKAKPNELDTLLQTNDPKEQAERVKQLMNPTLTLAITLDTRTGQVSLTNVGVPIPAQAAYQMLDMARQALLEQERKAVQTKDGDSNTPG